MNPVVFLALVFLGIYAVYGIGQNIGRDKQREADKIGRLLDSETDRDRRVDLKLQWSRLIGSDAHLRKAFEYALVHTQGRDPRKSGKSLSDNPYSQVLWGLGRTWKNGWLEQDREIKSFLNGSP